MILDCVTITGADDSVDPRLLSPLSERFPFVEWGILFSASQQGNPRYPSRLWVEKLKEVQLHRERVKLHPLKLCAHLCGRYVRDFVLEGRLSFADEFQLSMFRRIQLNFHGEYHRAHELFPSTIKLLGNYDWILQHDGVNDGMIKKFTDDPDLRVFPLFDKSGGAGIVPGEWPAPIWRYQGYAGGLGPENLVDEIGRISKAAGDARVWIDMETRVRSDGDARFDLAKVERCLEIASPFVKG
jgi:hypothetical protein